MMCTRLAPRQGRVGPMAGVVNAAWLEKHSEKSPCKTHKRKIMIKLNDGYLTIYDLI